jgi:hypothetical protein
MIYPPPRPKIPECSWKRPLGLGWDKPYTVRYPSNLDDGPWHGMPLGGFGAGCIGRSPRGDFNLWHLDGGEHTFKSLPACQFSVFERAENSSNCTSLCPVYGTAGGWHLNQLAVVSGFARQWRMVTNPQFLIQELTMHFIPVAGLFTTASFRLN